MATESELRDYLRKAAKDLSSVRREVEELRAAAHEPIAIVGMSCRFPGGQNVPEFWDLLSSGRSAVTEVDPNRLELAAYDPAGGGGSIYTRYGALLDDIAGFDAEFFEMPPAEAIHLDPHHRLLMELAWEGFEDAAVPPGLVAGSRVGVLVGFMDTCQYGRLQMDRCGAEIVGNALFSPGVSASIAAGRIAYHFDLKGPSLTVDTACSSSLVATHLAVQALRRRECDLALSAGVFLAMQDDVYLGTCATSQLTRGDQCRTFDRAADGYVLGEGGGLVVLERLSDAVAAGRHIHAVIHGSAVNQDGYSNGLTAPNRAAQVAVIKAALADAQIEPDRVGYVETHGSATQLGDTVELSALGDVFGPRRAEQAVRLGAVKTNIGHTQSAAGMAGLIKATLATEHTELPPNRGLEDPTDALAETDGLRVLTDREPGPADKLTGVSSFGWSGTNAHLILGPAPDRAEAIPEVTDGPVLLPVSARTPAALAAQTERLAAHLAAHPELALPDVSHTLAHGRTEHEFRRAVVGVDRSELVAALRRPASGGRARTGSVAFLLPGVGDQYPGMAADLFAQEPIFAGAVQECRALLREGAGVDLPEELFTVAPTADLDALSPTGPAQPPEVAHPYLFTVEYALATLLRHAGARPDAFIGYSLGEYVAACLAGVLDLPSALAVVVARARLIAGCDTGAMLAVAGGQEQAYAAIAASGAPVDVAALNGPSMTVLSGTADAVAAVGAQLTARGIPSQPLRSDTAFHSRLLRPAEQPLADVLAQVALNPPEQPVYSNRTGRPLSAEEATDPASWAAHLTSTVHFGDAVRHALEDGVEIFVEIGAGQTLGGILARDFADADAVVVPTLPSRHQRTSGSTGDRERIVGTMARLWEAGQPIDWDRVSTRPGHPVPLPTYPFQRTRLWPDEPATHVGEVVPSWVERPGQAAVVGPVALLGGAAADRVTVADALRAAGHVVLDGDPAVAQGIGAVVDLSLLAGQVSTADAIRDVARRLDAAAAAGPDTRVVVATRGGQSVHPGEAPLDPAQAAVGVLPVVAGHEYVGLHAQVVDLGADDPATDLVPELAIGPDQPVVARRGGRRWERTFVAADPARAAEIRNRSFLITGGLGDVGLRLAEHLAEHGAERVLLASRSARPDHPALQRFTGVRATVEAVPLDVTDADAVAALLDDLAADGARVHAVLHAAGSTSADTFVPLRDLDDEVVAAQLGAKVEGLRALSIAVSRLPADRAPEAVLAFSSTAAVLGGLAFGAYAAANAALPAVAAQHNATGGPTRFSCVAWDTWEVTAAQLDQSGPVGASMRDHTMRDAEAMGAFDRVLGGLPAWSLVTAGSLDRRLAGVGAPSEDVPADLPRFPRPDLPQPYAEPVGGVERDLAELWSSTLRVEPVGTTDNFFDLGGNSLLAMQMLTAVKDKFGVAIAAVDLFESPTVRTLAGMLPGGEPPVVTPVVAHQPVAEVTTDHLVAVVGMAGRFPGAADVGGLWRNLCDGVESLRTFSREELLAAGVPRRLVDDPAYVPARPVLDDVAGFDAAFFGMSPRTAEFTDPQQRLFLESCWEALEQAGYAVAGPARGRVGVFGGSNFSSYLLQLPPEVTSGETASIFEVIAGNEKDALTTAASYVFDLRGPSVAVQTFCSTSLVATHLAVQSLRAGECEIALAGGVSVRVPVTAGHLYGPGGQESPDGHVRTFDAQARGATFGDGVAVVALKPLAAALRDGDHIWSVIRGSAMNNDGALKVGFTAPSVVGQAQVVADAMADAGVAGQDVGYVEAHGSATELGDPIEVAALARAFGDGPARQSCPIGSVKTNVGHLDRAAGVTGLIKASMTVNEGVIPPSLHYRSPNPQIDFAASPFLVNADLSLWQPQEGTRRIAGVNSLGMGGTNVHVVVEEPPARAVQVEEAPERRRRLHVLPVSGRTEDAADQGVERLGEHLAQHPDLDLAEVAFTLQAGRASFEHRRAVLAATTDSARAGLDHPLQRFEPTCNRPVGFLFAGVGEQHPGMVRSLYRREPVFQDALEECLAHLDPELGVRELLTGDREIPSDAIFGASAESTGRAKALARTEVVQPAVFAAEHALAVLLETWGLRPSVLLGYSLGEYVAATRSGVLDLRDATRLVAERARLIGALDPGAMAAIGLGEQELAERYDLAARGVDVAALNGPEVTVVAGEVDAVTDLLSGLAQDRVAARRLSTDAAVHSRLMRPAAEPLQRWIAEHVTLRPVGTPYVSNVTGGLLSTGDVLPPDYWTRHLCQPVRFADAVETLLAEPGRAYVEIGAGPSLGSLVRSGRDAESAPHLVSTLPAASDRREDDEVLTEALARLWLAGVEPDWAAYHNRGPTGRRPGRVPLPTYAFQRHPYWLGGPRREEPPAASAPDGAVGLDELGSLPRLPEQDWIYRPVWRQVGPPLAAEAGEGAWLVLSDTPELAAALVPEGLDHHLVRPGAAYAAGDEGFVVRPGEHTDLAAVLRDLRSRGQQVDRVVHLWSVTDTEQPHRERVRRALHTVVACLRAAAETSVVLRGIDVVVAGTQPILPSDVTDPVAAMLVGPVLVGPLEHPELRARLIDLDPEDIERQVPAVRRELSAEPTDRVVALRHGRRWLPEHEPVPGAEPAEPVLRHGGVYLVTGGMGGIALGLAERLVRELDARLVLLSRRPRPVRAEWPDGLDDAVEVVLGDATDVGDLRRGIDAAHDRFGALHGVLHLAGSPGQGLMQLKDAAAVDAVLAPKVDGALALAEALRVGTPEEEPLEVIAFFSSVAAVTGGGPGQADYSAANAFLDAYAAVLDRPGRRVRAIDWAEWAWNAWDDGLDGYEAELRAFFVENRERVGIDFDAGWRTLGRALATAEPRVVVSSQDFPTLVRYSAGFSLSALANQRAADTSHRHPRPDLVTPLREPSDELEESVAEVWASALCLQDVGVDDNFFELGGNSLLGVQIVDTLRQRHPGRELPPHVLYEAPTVAQLVSRALRESANEPDQTAEDESSRARLRRSGMTASATRRRGR